MLIRPQGSRVAARAAFTLMEVLVVVAILVILASVAGVYVFRNLEDARKDKAKIDCENIAKACDLYRLRNNDAPPPSLEQLIAPPDGGKPFLDGGQAALMDPWGKPYSYDPSGARHNGLKVDVMTTAPDGAVIINN
jgi:general secretion pathway protein G